MKKILLTLLMAVAFVSLCPRVAHATQTISGTVNVSSLTDTRIALSGNVTLVVNEDHYLREIIGANYKLTLVLNGSYTLTVDQDKKNTGAIDVASLEIKGTGNLLSTGRNFGAYIRGGELLIDNYTGTAAFHGRDGDWAHAISIIDNATVNINSGTVECQTTDGWGIGGKGKVNITGSNTVVNISSDQDGINIYSGTGTDGYGRLTMNGAKLNVYGQRKAIECSSLYLDSGASINAYNDDRYAGIDVVWLEANESSVSVTSVGNGIEVTYLRSENTYFYAYGGSKAYGIYGRTKPAGSTGLDGFLIFRGYSSNSKVYADGDYAGIYGEANIEISNRYLYAKARSSNSRAVATAGDLSFYNNAYSVYEAYSPDCPFYAGGEIRMHQPFNDRFTGIFSMRNTTDRYDVSTDKHYFITYSGSGMVSNTVPVTGYACIKGNWIGEANVDMTGTLQIASGYSFYLPGSVCKGQQVNYVEPQLLTDYVLHNPTNNPVTIYPNPAPVRTVEWYRVDDTGLMTKVATGDSYVAQAADVGYKLKAMVSYSSHQGAIYSSEMPVWVRQNTNEPVAPYLQISQPTGSTNRYVYVNPPQPDQEYIVMTTRKEISDLTESDWANARSASSGVLQMCVADYDHVYYVYTRFKASQYAAPGTYVKMVSISGGTSVNFTGFTMTATPMNGATLILDELGYCCLKNTVVKLTLSPQPSNATNFSGALGSLWSIPSECGALYADAACTQSLVSTQYYKTVYAKLMANRASSGNLVVSATVYSGSVYQDYLYFVVANDNGTWDPWKLDMGSYLFRVTKGSTVTNSFVAKPEIAVIPDVTVQYVSYTGSLSNPIPPTVTIDTQAKTFTINATGATADDNGRYLFYFKDGDRQLAFINVVVEKRPVESVNITPSEVTLDPEVGQLQLQAAIYPASAEGDVVWTSSVPNYLSVDENGLVTLLNNSATLGETYYITAQVDDVIDTCVVHVGGEKYGLTVGGTRVTSLNKGDILGNGLAAYDNGRLYLNGGIVGTATSTSPAISSQMPSLEIQVNQVTRVRSKSTLSSIVSSGNLIFMGTGTLLVENNNTRSDSRGIVAKNIIVRNRTTVGVAKAAIGVTATNGVSVIGLAQLGSYGTYVSLESRNYFSGEITEPAGATWDPSRGVVVLNGETVSGQAVVVNGIPVEPAYFIRGDVNGDGDVTIADVSALIDYLLTGDATNINLNGADCDLANGVTIADVSALIDRLLNGSW